MDMSISAQSWSPRAGCKTFGNLLHILHVLDPETVLPRQRNAYVSMNADAVRRSAVEVSAFFTPDTLVC